MSFEETALKSKNQNSQILDNGITDLWLTWGSDSCATTVECMCILLSRCPPTACFGLWDWVVWVAACKVTVAADSAMFNQSRGPIVMVWAMDFVNTWRRTGISWGRWDMTLVWSAPRWCRQGQQFCKIKFELRHKLKSNFNHLCIPEALMQKCNSVKIWNTYASRTCWETKRPPCSNSSECCYLRSRASLKQRKCQRESEGRERDSLWCLCPEKFCTRAF